MLSALSSCASVEAASPEAPQTGFGHYILLFPGSTIETDLSGHCVSVENVSGGAVYLVVTSASEFRTSLEAYRRVLNVHDCRME